MTAQRNLLSRRTPHTYITFVAIAQDVCYVYVTNKVTSPGRMPHIRVYVTCRMHAVLQRYFLTLSLSGGCFEFSFHCITFN